MQKTITKLLMLTIILTAALSVNYLFAVWTGPTQAPPLGNTLAPINIGQTNQVKDGGLSVNALTVFGNGYVEGDIGIGVISPSEALEVAGNVKADGIKSEGNVDATGNINATGDIKSTGKVEATQGLKVGNTTAIEPGTIRWTGSDFEGFDGTQWISMTGGNEPVAPLASADCDAAGGSWEGGDAICYFKSQSCPSGWTKKELYSSTKSKSCVDGPPGLEGCTHKGCATSSHFRSNAGIESCSYSGTCSGTRGKQSTVICTATQVEVGCTITP